jgi:hypothetical protein
MPLTNGGARLLMPNGQVWPGTVTLATDRSSGSRIRS